MHRTVMMIMALGVLAVPLAGTAAAQRMRVRISPREDGGETIGLDEPDAPTARPRPPDADAQQTVARAAAMVTAEITARGRLSPEVARRAMALLNGPGLAPQRLNGPSQVLFYRTVAYAAALADDATLASRAAEQWVRLAPADAAALRAAAMAAMLNRDRRDAVEAIGRLASPPHASWAAWARYMSPLVALAGERPQLTLTTLDGQALRTADLRGTVVVLYVWTAASGGEDAVEAALAAQRRLAAPYEDDRVTVVGINLDGKADRDTRRVVAALRERAGDVPQVVRGSPSDDALMRAADELGITAVPTAGSVPFAGAPRTWETHAAIDCARANDPRTVGPQTPDATETAETPETPAAAPAEPSEATEREARALRDEGIKLIRLGLNTGSAAHRRQGRDLLEQVIREYPDTRAAEQARHDLIVWQR